MMIRIGIIGSENSHAKHFSELANLDHPSGGARVPEVQVVSVYGEDYEQAAAVAKAGQVPMVAKDPLEMLGQIDAVMVTARHGGKHCQYALPFIEAGIPTFVDKPFAISLSDCQTMVETAKKRGTLLTSYSTLRYTNNVQNFINRMDEVGELVAGVSTGPCDFDSEYGGPFFYGTHAIEVMLAIFGHDVKSVYAKKVGKNCTAIVEFASGATCNLNLLKDASYVFHAAVYGTKAWESIPVDLGSGYPNGFRNFINMIQTATLPLTFEQIIDPIRILHGVVSSLESESPVFLK